MTVYEREVFVLTMIISGPKQSGYDINMYLTPLINDLMFLWEDEVRCFDAYKEEYFTLWDGLLWAIYVVVVSRNTMLVQYVERRLPQ